MPNILGIQFTDEQARNYNTQDLNGRIQILRFIGRGDLADRAAQEWAQETYGYLGGALGNSEVKALINKAGREGWSEARTIAALHKTKYWQTHAANERNWTQLKKDDPATAKQMLANAKESLSAMAFREGVTLSGSRAKKMAERIASGGITDEAAIRRMVIAEAKYSENAGASALTQQASEIKARASEYGITLTGQGAFDWAKRVEGGTADPAIVDEYLRQQATARFADNAMILAGLKRGQTVRDILDPQIAQLSDLLEMDPDTINLTDPRWSPIIEHVDGDKMRVMTSAEAARFARSQNEYRTTANAQASAASLAEKLTQTFGQVG